MRQARKSGKVSNANVIGLGRGGTTGSKKKPILFVLGNATDIKKKKNTKAYALPRVSFAVVPYADRNGGAGNIVKERVRHDAVLRARR